MLKETDNIPVITIHSRLKIRSLSIQQENGVVVIGRHGQFLELPPEGIPFIEWLNEGATLGEAHQRFEAEFGPFPEDDLHEVMQAFRDSDFIEAIDDELIPETVSMVPDDGQWLPQSVAQALFSTPMLIAWMVIVVPAVGLWVATPSLWPRYGDYFWVNYNFVIILVGLLVWLAHIFIHEMFHLVAARAKGIQATIMWTQRLGFFPVNQTVMHNIWAVPRTSRFLPIVAGLMFDMLLLSSTLYVLSAYTYQAIALPFITVRFLKFLVLIITMAITSQFWLFSKMDGYFLFSALLGQRNLQSDTYHWLRSKISSTNSFIPPTDGMRYIYIYAVITMVWGVFFMGQFLLIELPIRLRLLWESLLKITLEGPVVSVEFADGVATLVSQGIDIGLLIYAYWRETLPNLRNR